MDGDSLEQSACEAYQGLLNQLGAQWHPVRIWNCVPEIVGDAGGGLNRYMRFNAGRHRALGNWLGSVEAFECALPAASAVGTDGEELTIHILACPRRGFPVHNPRQRPPHRYSPRFGPKPPCFARGTLVEQPGLGPVLLVGGTASVRGEDSVHLDDLPSQIDETVQNLAALVCAGWPADEPRALDYYRELRVYHPRAQDQATLQSVLPGRFPQVRAIEFVLADLCRPELLVEIEGLALPPGRANNHGRP